MLPNFFAIERIYHYVKKDIHLLKLFVAKIEMIALGCSRTTLIDRGQLLLVSHVP